MTTLLKQHFCQDRKFTVIIPTRDRADTLFYTLASVVAQDYSNLEIIVSDNASEDHTRDVVKGFSDPRVRYINTGKRVSMSHNWEFALNHVTDGWITVLGDDDAILPGALKTVNKIIDTTGTQAIRANGCNYEWPRMTANGYGLLSVSTKKGYKKVKSEVALGQVMAGKLYYNNLPVLYNGGFIDFSLVREAKSITKSFFLSMTPDVYAGIVFSLLTDEYIYSYKPLAINGASHHSGGTAAFESAKRNRSYNPAEKFWREENIPFHPSLPLTEEGRPVRSIQAIVYEAYLQASDFHKRKKSVYDIVSPEQQLEIILSQASRQTMNEIKNWSAAFSRQNNIGLYYPFVKSSIIPSYLTSSKKVFALIDKAISSRTLSGDKELMISNVYEASIVASLLIERNLKTDSLVDRFFRKFKLA